MHEPDPYKHLLEKPIAQRQMNQIHLPPGSDQGQLKQRISILVVEDDVEFAMLLKDYLEGYGYSIRIVSNGAKGLKQVMSMDFDIILCDMMMPRLPGNLFYLAVEKVKPKLCKRFIFMTGHQGDPQIDKFIRSIRGKMLWKPIQLQDLLDTINSIVKRYNEVI